VKLTQIYLNYHHLNIFFMLKKKKRPTAGKKKKKTNLASSNFGKVN
jgi:hypothetical protein